MCIYSDEWKIEERKMVVKKIPSAVAKAILGTVTSYLSAHV